MITAEQITGLILAGGRAQRMGGNDKGLITFRGKPLIEIAIERLQTQVGQILINANRNITKYTSYGYPVLMDETTDFSGPLAGFAIGLKHCETPYLLTSPCDSPLLPLDLAQQLARKLENEKLDLVYASTQEAAGAIWAQPVFCLMRSDLGEQLKSFMDSDQLKIDRWFKELNSGTVIFDDVQGFVNVNTPEDLQALDKISL
jgi:molybdopterin-guanine dinucleotide biosynthesis protein A